MKAKWCSTHGTSRCCSNTGRTIFLVETSQRQVIVLILDRKRRWFERGAKEAIYDDVTYMTVLPRLLHQPEDANGPQEGRAGR